MKSIRIGNGCGFWGDDIDAPIALAKNGNLHYLTLEYLAELTMSILAKLRERDANAGYATDFLDVLDKLGPILHEQPQLKIVTNAGGMNPQACGKQALALLQKHGLQGTVATVSGDDLLPRLDELLAGGHTLKNLDTAEDFATIRAKVVSANAYLGSQPIAEALALGARVVVTGRVADASLTVGPAAHEFGWAWNDWDKLAAGTLAGHLVECGAQMTGGLYRHAKGLETVGYPIAEITSDGSMVFTKPTNTGGVVNLDTVAEQLLYEVNNPTRYLTPDVVADFTTANFTQTAENQVTANGTKGLPATDSYKVSIAYRDGYTASGMLVVCGPNAVTKARTSGKILLDKLKSQGYTFAHSYVEVLGGGDGVPGVIPLKIDPPEVVVRVAVRDAKKANVERFTKSFAPLVTAGLPGTTGYTTGRPVTREVFAYWPALIAMSAVTPMVQLVNPA